MDSHFATTEPKYGIAAIGGYDPGLEELSLPNSWFEARGIIGRKFAAHTGITSRGISFLSEREMALRAIEDLKLRTGFDIGDCRGLILSSSSLVPMGQPDWRRDCLRALGRWDDLHQRIGPATGLPQEILRSLEWSDDLKDWDGVRRLARRIGMSDEQLGSFERSYLSSLGSLEETTAAVARGIGLAPAKARAVNWGCSGYGR